MAVPKQSRARLRGRPGGARGVSFDALRELAAALPGVEASTSYGTPAFRVRKKLLARLREDGESLMVKMPLDQREVLMEADPETFFVTDHYRDYPAVLVALPRVRPDELAVLLEQAWREAAPRRLVIEFDRAAEGGA